MQKQKALIIFGGVSNEYEVSLRSAVSIIENIDRERFEPVTLGITRDGRWRIFEGETSMIAADRWEESSRPAFLSPDRAIRGVTVLGEKPENIRVDVIFPAMHGQHCEDGAIQGLMELSGIPYVGCGIAASALGFDKILTHIICGQAGIPMAKWASAKRGEPFEDIERRVAQKLGYPCFVKPASSGSSVGCSRAESPDSLRQALKLAFAEDENALIEELITAQEVECAVIGNLSPSAPTTGEIVSADGFYDYDSKYKNDTARLLIPAAIPGESQKKVRELACGIYKLLGCRGLSRVDFFVRADGEVLFNEINTLPGFTSISMYPKMMTASGQSYSGLITGLIELALEEHDQKEK